VEPRERNLFRTDPPRSTSVCVSEPDPADFPARLAAGDRNVEQDIFRAYAKQMNKAALAVFGSKDRSVRGKSFEDAVQEACQLVHRKQLLAGKTNIPGFLVQVVTARALEMVRSRKTDAVAGAEALEHVEGSGAAEIERVERALDAGQLHEDSAEVVSKLLENEQKVFHLLYEVGMTFAETADHLGMTERGIRGINKRIIEHIRKQLGVTDGDRDEGGG